MHIHELMRLKENELVQRLKPLDEADLERHARELIAEMGSDNYAGVMSQVMKAVQEDLEPDQSRFDKVQQTLQSSLPNQAYMSDIYARLAAIVMMIISKKFKTLYNKE